MNTVQDCRWLFDKPKVPKSGFGVRWYQIFYERKTGKLNWNFNFDIALKRQAVRVNDFWNFTYSKRFWNKRSLLGQWINIYHWKTNLDMPYCILMYIIIQINKRGSWLSMETTAELGNRDIFQIKRNISDTLWNGEFFCYWAVTGYNGTKTLVVEQSDRKILRAIFRFCVKARKNVELLQRRCQRQCNTLRIWLVKWWEKITVLHVRQFRAVPSKTTTWNYHICCFDDHFNK